jgi:diguanylate cyclase (GGDEF)-like protein
MFLLAWVSFLLSATACFVCLYAHLRERRGEERLHLDLVESTCQGWENRRQVLRQEIRGGNHQLARTMRLYETARDICAALEEEELFARFRENLRKFISYDRCYIADEAPVAHSSDPVRRVFPLESQGLFLGALVVEGSREEGSPFPEALVRPFVLGLRRARLYRIVQELAITDALTGLYTRRYALGRLSEELRRCEHHRLSLAVLMIDVDDFKSCNDRFGHLVGDAVLREIGGCIRESVREVDMLARYGGEEFLVVAPVTSKDSALFVAERIRTAMQDRTIRAYDERLKITVSIGVASFPGDAARPEDLVRRADEAMYRAKRLGKNRVAATESG